VLTCIPVIQWCVAGLAGALVATSPWRTAIPARSEIDGRPVAGAATGTSDEIVVRGWLVRVTDPSTDIVVLAAGIQGNRLAMIERGEWYLAHGWSVLLVDLRGTGAAPVSAIKQLRAPTLCACGVDDEKVGVDATEALLAASGAAIKERVEVPGIGHGDLWHAGSGVLPRRLEAFVAAR
jgi:pimeloyl-ACP methyl ester carboxylesterase